MQGKLAQKSTFDTATSTPKPPAQTATATKRTLTRKDKGKAPVRSTPRTPAPEATVELDSDDDNDEEMPDAPQPPAPAVATSIPRAEEHNGSNTTLEETPMTNQPSSKARYKRVATKRSPKYASTRTEKEEMLQYSRKDVEQHDTVAMVH
ncbi:hypothetical protein V6N11_031304 [Hibiscus sabdariffa]|uniref:Uncharacterized protein n=1 Tax=Hibiscus sabdariffa TaxID=183260 RepID=A0ABR2SX84_9ROSI